MFSRAIELARRSRYDQSSAFSFDRVVLNLPTSKAYDPKLPRILKMRSDGLIASEEVTFVDDTRTLADSEPLADRAT